MTHRLTDRDLETRTATCAICGPVKIQRSGNGWACGNRANAQSRKQKRANPQRDRTSKTEHVLEWQSTELLSGLCRECGPVDIVPWGRGYACGARAKELGRVNHQDAPQTWCRDCWAEMAGDPDRYRVWLLADGTCPRCSSGQDLGTELRALEDGRQALVGLEPGFHLVSTDPYSMPDYESAVPGWHTIGTRA
jgi:hypothetical protein